MAKLPITNYIALALVGIVAVAGGMAAVKYFNLMPAASVVGGGADNGASDIEIVSCPLTGASTVTLSTPDVYGGAAVASNNMYRRVGESTFTNIAGGATFNGFHGNQYEICAGVNTSNSTAEPYGACTTYTVPCDSNPTAVIPVVNDALATNLDVTFMNPDNQTVIGAASQIDIDNGDVKVIRTTWTGVFQQDFGNRYCGKGNTLIVSCNNSEYTRCYATDLNGNEFPSAPIPASFQTTALFVNKAYEVPVLKSLEPFVFNTVLDASGTGKAPDGGLSNVTVTLYDSDWYEDNDVTPPQVKCGVNDEDGSDNTGAVAADTGTIVILDD